MKTFNKRSIASASFLGLALVLASALNTHAAPGGTDITHLMSFTSMTNSGVDTNAVGMVFVSEKTQGHADNETLTIRLSGLETNMDYELVAIYDTDTNVVDISSFSPDGNGKAHFDYTSLGNGHGGGKKSLPLPDSLKPVSLIRELNVVDTNMQVVLSADLTDPERLHYLIKRNLSSGDMRASLMIQADAQHTHFRLSSTGLTPNADYWLAFNGEVVQTNTTSANGRLEINSLSETPPIILDVRSVELRDTSSNVVLQATLP